ncbi:MAG: hypothetical protein KDC24_01905 [Saprospiraceae bacterium]|nr:hypothetical protein [Saprospiraceae bacterium]
MKKLIFLVLVASAIWSCKTEKYISKGYFNTRAMPATETYFITDIRPLLDPNFQIDTSLPKLTDNSLNYFQWKTVRYNKPITKVQTRNGVLDTIDYNESFSSFRTLENHTIDNLSPESRHYLLGAKNVFKNYLFFLDDYRCIYLSEDDDRNNGSLGDLYLHFDKQYKPFKDANGSQKQMLRGYYTKDGDEIFFDFEFDKHFYVKATIENSDRIRFDSIYVPEEKRVKNIGMNAEFFAFKDLVSNTALPIFERPQEGDVVKDDHFSLYFGFLNNGPNEKDRNDLHKAIIEKTGNLPPNSKLKILDITYNLDEVSNPIRTYRFIVQTDGMNQPKVYTVEEELRLEFEDMGGFFNMLRSDDNKRQERRSQMSTW